MQEKCRHLLVADLGSECLSSTACCHSTQVRGSKSRASWHGAAAKGTQGVCLASRGHAKQRRGVQAQTRARAQVEAQAEAWMRAWRTRVSVSQHGVAATTHRYTRTQVQGGSRKMQQALPAEASIPRPWREVANRMREGVRKQLGTTCVGTRECPGPRHGCTHGQAGSRRWHAWVQFGSRRGTRGRERDMERSRGEPCTSWQHPCQGRGTGSRSSHAGARKSDKGLDKDQNSDLDKDVNSAPRVNSVRQGVWNGLNSSALRARPRQQVFELCSSWLTSAAHLMFVLYSFMLDLCSLWLSSEARVGALHFLFDLCSSCLSSTARVGALHFLFDLCSSCWSSALHAWPLQLIVELGSKCLSSATHAQVLHFMLDLCSSWLTLAASV
ncbi:hypothetical protein SLEP1_g22460 [Rubroshorea leprosula]|uniref:Uncharacterized protein n=1 Tax=Rubroshorea leprosula TaxID=152421 RepID=A0AAV5JCA3_9ROSI|nr:hypothetical protein SLEP1_g22460 [Rubroshorea leprosula]